MEHHHIYERGKHTSVAEVAVPVINLLRKNIPDIQFSPGKIEVFVGAKSASIKFKHIKNGLYQMTIVNKGSRQELAAYTNKSFEEMKEVLKQDKKTQSWNINYVDMRPADSLDLDKKYLVPKS
jgi:uncharacterized protein (DUF849 family)